MIRIRMLFAAVLVLAVSSLVFSQEPDKEPKAPPQAEPHDAAPSRAQEQKPPKPEKQQMQKPEEQKPRNDDAKSTRDERNDHAQTARAGHSAHIPDARFKASFGRQHTFSVNRVVTQRTIVPGQTQFVYSGYTFVFVDPWPAEWAFTDDCYIDYVNEEYALVDPLHPGVFLTLNVIL